MANLDTFLQGNDEDNRINNSNVRTFTGVIDLADAVTDGFASGDVIRLVELPAGTMFLAFDARITQALVNVTNTDFGNTIADATDPDDYVDAQTTTAVGAYGAYTAGSVAPTRLASDCYLAFSAVTSGSATGKIAWSCTVIIPPQEAVEIAAHRTYTNS